MENKSQSQKKENKKGVKNPKNQTATYPHAHTLTLVTPEKGETTNRESDSWFMTKELKH